MTDPWDELWENMPTVVYGLRGGKSTHVEWLNEIKAEGDSLKDELRRYKNSFHLIKLAGGKEVQLAQKLVAVEDLVPKWREEVKEYPDTVKGLHARAAVTICRKELEEALK